MPIDPAIPLQIRPPTFPNPLETYGQFMQLRNMQQQSQMQRMQMEEQQRLVQRQKALDNAFKLGGTDPKKIADTLIQAGQGNVVPEFLKRWYDQDAAFSEAETKKLAASSAMDDYVGGLAYQFKQSGYNTDVGLLALKHMASKGIDVKPYLQRLAENPVAFNGIADELIAKSPKWSEQATKASAEARAQAGEQRAQTAEQRAQQGFDVEQPGRASDAFAKQMERAAQALAAVSGNADQYEALRGDLPFRVASLFKPHAQWDPKTIKQDVLAVGLTPSQQVTTAMTAAQRAEQERHNRVMEQRPVGGAYGTGGLDVDPKAIAQAIADGEQPPTTTGLYRYGAAIRSELAKMNYDLSKAQTDWAATQRHFSTLNGPQQTRLRQAAETAYHSLDIIEELANQWSGTQFPALNKVNLLAAKQGVYGKDAQSVAVRLDAQISDVTSELANVYMGGNSPTDHAMELAAKNLGADWSKKTLLDALKLSRTNLQIRLNSIKQTGVISTTPNNQYTRPESPQAGVPAQTAAPTTAGPRPGARRQVDGKWYLWDGMGWKLVPG